MVKNRVDGFTAALLVGQRPGASPGQPAQVKNQEAVKKLPQLFGLCRRWFEA